MKLFTFVLLFALAHGQDRTVTEDLVGAQGELTIGHEFAELFLVQNRQRLSDYLETIEEVALDEFLTAYATIKNRGIETREAMEEFTEPSFCKDNIRARWELQVTRYGQKLSQCLGDTLGYLHTFNNILNGLHDESRAYSNIIPNAGVNILSSLDIFDGRDSLQDYINRQMRDLLFRAFDFHAEFEELIDGISLDLDSLLEQYTECYRTLPVSFGYESEADLESIRLCYGD